MTKATTPLVYNAVGIYAPGHVRYNKVDLYPHLRQKKFHFPWESNPGQLDQELPTNFLQLPAMLKVNA